VLDLLPAATAVLAARGAQRYFLAVAGLLGQEGLVGALLPELAVCLLLLQVHVRTTHGTSVVDPESDPDPRNFLKKSDLDPKKIIPDPQPLLNIIVLVSSGARNKI
jgi:hypothetical protein